MHFQTFVLLLAAVAAAGPPVSLRRDNAKRGLDFPQRCFPNPCQGITNQSDSAVCGDPRLGPIDLPTSFPLSTELQTYSRFGDLCPYEFLAKWSQSVDNTSAPYIYPYANGFANNTDIIPIMGNFTLTVGQKIDRFGSERGNFLSPLGAPYIERALPPVNLFTRTDSGFPYNYHVYEVIREFAVSLGPVTPWFEQPGLGTQFMTHTSVENLVQGGYLRRLELSEYDQPDDYSADYLTTPPHPAPTLS